MPESQVPPACYTSRFARFSEPKRPIRRRAFLFLISKRLGKNLIWMKCRMDNACMQTRAQTLLLICDVHLQITHSKFFSGHGKFHPWPWIFSANKMATSKRLWCQAVPLPEAEVNSLGTIQSIPSKLTQAASFLSSIWHPHSADTSDTSFQIRSSQCSLSRNAP